MPSVPAGDWEYEESDEAEPYEAADPYEAAEPYEAADPWESEDSEAESDFEADRIVYRRAPPPRPYTVAVKGVQTAVVRTPAGNANIQLPSRVPTVTELRGTFNRVQRDMAATNRRLRLVSATASQSRRASSSAHRAARNAILIVVLDQVKDVLRDVGTFSMIRDAAAGAVAAAQDAQKNG